MSMSADKVEIQDFKENVAQWVSDNRKIVPLMKRNYQLNKAAISRLRNLAYDGVVSGAIIQYCGHTNGAASGCQNFLLGTHLISEEGERLGIMVCVKGSGSGNTIYFYKHGLSQQEVEPNNVPRPNIPLLPPPSHFAWTDPEVSKDIVVVKSDIKRLEHSDFPTLSHQSKPDNIPNVWKNNPLIHKEAKTPDTPALVPISLPARTSNPMVISQNACDRLNELMDESIEASAFRPEILHIEAYIVDSLTSGDYMQASNEINDIEAQIAALQKKLSDKKSEQRQRLAGIKDGLFTKIRELPPSCVPTEAELYHLATPLKNALHGLK